MIFSHELGVCHHVPAMLWLYSRIRKIKKNINHVRIILPINLTSQVGYFRNI
jgi:hypothetical protein